MLPIRSGPLKGKKWIAVSGIRFLRGNYVQRDTEVFLQNVKPGDVVYDIGAHVGYFSVLASKLVGTSGSVASFEPLPINVNFLRRHLSANHCKNVSVFTSCVGESRGQLLFDDSRGTGTGRISERGRRRVDVVNLDDLFTAGRLPAPTFIKINAEGSELQVLKGGAKVIADHKPFLLITLHDNLMQQCIDWLQGKGYEVNEIADDAITARCIR
jgi:FkbM family methyltransferase